MCENIFKITLLFGYNSLKSEEISKSEKLYATKKICEITEITATFFIFV